jgi:hypothetical protein
LAVLLFFLIAIPNAVARAQDNNAMGAVSPKVSSLIQRSGTVALKDAKITAGDAARAQLQKDDTVAQRAKFDERNRLFSIEEVVADIPADDHHESRSGLRLCFR